MVHVTVTLRGPELPSADELPQKSLTPEQFAAHYSASKADVDKVARCLTRFGLIVDDVSFAARSMRVSGTVAQMEAAFHPGLGIYRIAGQAEFRDREGYYEVPKEIGDIVTGVIGFGTRRVAHRRHAAVRERHKLPSLTPADIERVYNFPAGSAKDEKIAIAEFGGGYFESDLQDYCAKFHIPEASVHAVAVNKPAYTLEEVLKLPASQRKQELDDSIEVMMDVQIIAGLCPGADIRVYFATFDQQGWVSLLNQAIADRPVSLSVSWGMAEDDSEWSKAGRQAISERLSAAALLGITVCVASGDDGSGDEETDRNGHVDFPGSSPFVLCVGGTMMVGSVSTDAERVWWESPGRRTRNGGGATGGGVSTLFPRPKWQRVQVASINRGSIDGRVVPDVAALAGSPFYDLIMLGKPAPDGGTSASAPVWAALIARVDARLPAAKRQRFLTPLLYETDASGRTRGSRICHDIVDGNNISHPYPGKGYSAGTGFDAVCGWGTPDGEKLLASL